MEQKLKIQEREMSKAQRAIDGRHAMNDSTKVIRLDGSRALRSKTANCVADFLNACPVEQMSHEEAQRKFEAYQEKVQAERDTEPKQEGSRMSKEEEEEYLWYTGHARQMEYDSDYTEEMTDKECNIKDTVKQTEQKRISQTERKRPNTTPQQAPIFASFAGMDLLGIGLRKTFKAGKCVGGSEWSNSARLLFNREHGFDPFGDHDNVPDYAYKHVFMVTTGAPCVAFSRAGKQKGQSDRRGCYYVSQADDYIRAKVPVILFEQVREARDILKNDSMSRASGLSPHDQLVQKMEEAGYVVPTGPDGKPGIVINAADQGSVLDRSRLFTLAVTKELYDKSMKNKEFKWPQDKAANTRKIGDIFREPVDPSHIASKHVMEGFHDKKWCARTGVQYVYSNGVGIGEWYNPNTVISEEGKGLSITAMGNSRWIEFTDVDGEKMWRRLSGVETARAFGMQESELSRFQHLNDQEIHAAVDNGVCIEMGEAMGEVVQQFWDPEWFQEQCAKKAEENQGSQSKSKSRKSLF